MEGNNMMHSLSMRTLLPLLILSSAVLRAQSTAPSVISRRDPEFSDEARRARVQATVVLNITVGEDGKAREVQVAKGAGFGLDEKAVEAIDMWLFRPATKDGNAVAIQAQVEMNFRLLVKEPEDHSGQLARLNFNLPPGAARPELILGKLPGNPAAEGDQALRFRLQVDTGGTVKNITVLATTDPVWEKETIATLQSWRFRPAQQNGSPLPAEGIFELTVTERPAAEAAAAAATPDIVQQSGPEEKKPAPRQIRAFPDPRPIAGLNARVNHTATRLANGTILLAGGAAHRSETEPGSADFQALASAQIYDWATRKIVNTGSMLTARQNHTATLLRDGRVLIVGGRGDQPIASAEIYDPSSGTFSPAGNLREARESHTAALLPDGRVLVCGGTGAANRDLTSAEIYDPVTRAFTPAGNMTSARTSFHAVALQDGRVLLLGGVGAAGGTAEIYDPARATFHATGNMTTPRYGFSASALEGGQVLIAGGSAGSSGGPAMASAEIYDPATNSFQLTGPMTGPREFHTALLLADHKVLITGGIPGSPGAPLAATEIYDPATATFSEGPVLKGLHTGNSATLLQDGTALVAGSGLTGYGGSAELLTLR
jgi:TonB family protein